MSFNSLIAAPTLYSSVAHSSFSMNLHVGLNEESVMVFRMMEAAVSQSMMPCVALFQRLHPTRNLCSIMSAFIG